MTRAHVREGNEGIGPLAGDAIDAVYRLASGASGYFASHRGKGNRFGLRVHGSRGLIDFQSGYLSTAFLLKDPLWSPGRSGASWVPISSNGVGKPETRSSPHRAHLVAIRDLFDAIENERPTRSNAEDARAATEMIVAVFESHRVGGPVSMPLKNRKNPLTMLPA